MALKLITAPAVEPVTLAELKAHLRLDSGSLADNITSQQTISLASYEVVENYGLEGVAIDVLGYQVVVIMECGTNQAGGTVDVKLQQRDTTSDAWADVVDGGFTQVTTINDKATYEMDYMGGKRYLRAVATVAGAACVFGVTVQLVQVYSAEDSSLTSLIHAAREYVENYQNRALCTQTWELVLDAWPRSCIEMPLPPLQSITSIKYKDAEAVERSLESDQYTVDTDSYLGRIALADGISWPTARLWPVGGIRIRFVAGYGTAANVPQAVKQAILLLAAHWYQNRETINIGNISSELPFTTKALLALNRVIPV